MQPAKPLSFVPHDFRRIFVTEAVLNGMPPHIAQLICGHHDINTTMGYKAVYPEEVINNHRAFIARRRALRPSEEYRTPSDEEWEEFLGHFERRKVALGDCGRAYATPCIHEHACIRCPLLRPDPAQRPRLVEIGRNLAERDHRGEAQPLARRGRRSEGQPGCSERQARSARRARRPTPGGERGRNACICRCRRSQRHDCCPSRSPDQGVIMTDPTVTDDLLHELVSGSHAEGTTCLAVSAAIEDHDRMLLVATIDDDFEPVWQLPVDLVLPGETLLQGLVRMVNLTTGLNVVDVTGYTGHHDRVVDDEIVRTFVFTVSVDDPARVCCSAAVAHRWSSEPITGCSGLDDAAGHSSPTTSPSERLMGPNSLHQLWTALRYVAKGVLCAEAAVELLIEQQSWLRRQDFVEGFIERSSTSTAPVDRSDAASVDWVRALRALHAGHLPCSSGEGQLLCIAASLAEGISVDLRETITGLDSVNTELVARAIRHAAGHRL